jgi:cell division protein FtsB
MVIHTRFRRFASVFAFHLLMLGASAFFAWNAYIGDRGLVARKEHKLRIVQLERQLDELRIEHQGLERRVNGIAFDEADRDLLDERIRQGLNLAHRNDVVILIGK